MDLSRTFTTNNESPFAFAAPGYINLGLHVMAIHPHGKFPANYGPRGWYKASSWTLFCSTAPTAVMIYNWSGAPLANIGAALGSRIDMDHWLIAVDFDAIDRGVLAALLAAAPDSPMVRVASKGEARFYRAPFDIVSMAWNDANGTRLIDLLAHGKVIVLPPSRHPLGMINRWTAGPVPLTELPIFGAKELAALERAILALGGQRVGAARDLDERKPVTGAPSAVQHRTSRASSSDSVFADVNSTAMADLDAWVPALPIPNLRRKRDGYEGTAGWRPSSSDLSKPVEQRKRSLSIISRGIVDFGDGPKGYSGLDLVMAALGMTFNEAFEWLSMRLGMSTTNDPFFALLDEKITNSLTSFSQKEAQ